MADDSTDADKADERWTVRGVPERYRDAAAKAAQRSKMKVGAWLCEAIDAAIQAEREPIDISSPPPVSAVADDSADVLDRIERAVSSAVLLANAPDVPMTFRRRANRLLRDSLPSSPGRMLPRHDADQFAALTDGGTAGPTQRGTEQAG